MTELKWQWVWYPYLDVPNKQEESALKAGYIKVVEKDYIDKVIAEKDKQLRYNKYKRCRAMAKRCRDVWMLLRHFRRYSEEVVFYWRWWNIWLELANKFKEAKNVRNH